MLEDVRLAAEGKIEIFFSGYPGGRVPTESDIFQAICKTVVKLKRR